MSTFRRRQPRKEGKGNLAEMSSGHAVLLGRHRRGDGLSPHSVLRYPIV